MLPWLALVTLNLYQDTIGVGTYSVRLTNFGVLNLICDITSVALKWDASFTLLDVHWLHNHPLTAEGDDDDGKFALHTFVSAKINAQLITAKDDTTFINEPEIVSPPSKVKAAVQVQTPQVLIDQFDVGKQFTPGEMRPDAYIREEFLKFNIRLNFSYKGVHGASQMRCSRYQLYNHASHDRCP